MASKAIEGDAAAASLNSNFLKIFFKLKSSGGENFKIAILQKKIEGCTF